MKERIMAIDFGRKTGIAIGTSDGGKLKNILCGAPEMPKDDPYPHFYVHIRNYIRECVIDRIVFANVFHPTGSGNNAAHLWGGYHACTRLACQHEKLPKPDGYSEVSAKKYWTGNHQATKADVIEACRTHGVYDRLPLVTRKQRPSEDAADALMLLHFAAGVVL